MTIRQAVLWLQLCSAYKSLVVFPINNKSYNIISQAYVKHQLEAGHEHEVIFVTPFPTNRTTYMYHEVDLSQDMELNKTHPNLLLFITHSGLLSSTKAVFFDLPTVIMPYGNDQYFNTDRAVNMGFTLKVDLSYDMASDMKLAIEKMLSNPKYCGMKHRSMIYYDRLEPPAKELVHWVEPVIKTGGAPHLRSPVLLVPWYQTLYVELLTLVLVTGVARF